MLICIKGNKGGEKKNAGTKRKKIKNNFSPPPPPPPLPLSLSVSKHHAFKAYEECKYSFTHSKPLYQMEVENLRSLNSHGNKAFLPCIGE